MRMLRVCVDLMSVNVSKVVSKGLFEFIGCGIH